MRSTNVDQVLPSIKGMFLGLSKTQSMTFGRSKTVPNILIQCPIVSDKINSLLDFLDCVENLWSQPQTQKVLISSEAMRHCIRMFDTILERPKVIIWVFESPRNIPVSLGNIWSTFIDPSADQNVWKYEYYAHIWARVVLKYEFLWPIFFRNSKV